MSRSTAVVDHQIRAAEVDAYSHYGLTNRERNLRVQTGNGLVAVRLTLFGPEESSEPPILLLHGIASATVVAAPLIAHLEGRRVIAVDWPGHGLSGRCVLPRGTNIRAHATTTITSILDAMGIEQADIVGHSMGAQFALYMALDVPDRVGRLVLLGVPGAAFATARPIPLMVLLAIPGIGRTMLSAKVSAEMFLRNSEMALGPGAFASVPPSILQAGAAIGTRSGGPASVASFFRALIGGWSIRPTVGISDAELATLRHETLLVWGDQDVFLAPLEAAASIVSIRDCRLLRLAEAGHAPWLQAEAVTGSAVAQHLCSRFDR